MLFNSVSFLIFFPIVCLFYFVIPKKARYIWLLAASYYFYMSWNAAYALLLFGSTFVTYAAARVMAHVGEDADRQEAQKTKIKKMCVAFSMAINLGLLFFFKYFHFAASNLIALFSCFGIRLAEPSLDVLLPVGISFYIFQALGYTIDVYRGDVPAEKNFLRYALFVAFFPQLVAGPIERSKNLMKQLHEDHDFSFDRAREGLLLMLWGFFMKLVVADRIAIFVDAVYGGFSAESGWYAIVATVLFAFQIYCDFAGYSTIAMGAAKVMGFELMENFNCPYFSRSVGEFWRRWHISLSSWFRDYLYIPLGGNRKGAARKYVNMMTVFLVSGLWHGAMWTYVIWGGLNGLFQVIEGSTKEVRKKLADGLPIGKGAALRGIVKMLLTFCAVDFTWIFFRAESLGQALKIVRSVFTARNIGVLTDGSLYGFGLNSREYWMMWFSIGILLIADIFKYKGVKVRLLIVKQKLWIRWSLYFAGIFGILIFGIYGFGYHASNFIYFQF